MGTKRCTWPSSEHELGQLAWHRFWCTHADTTWAGLRAQAETRRDVMRREASGLRLAEELSEERMWVGIATLEASRQRQEARRHVLERKPKARRTPAEATALGRGDPLDLPDLLQRLPEN